MSSWSGVQSTLTIEIKTLGAGLDFSFCGKNIAIAANYCNSNNLLQLQRNIAVATEECNCNNICSGSKHKMLQKQWDIYHLSYCWPDDRFLNILLFSYIFCCNCKWHGAVSVATQVLAYCIVFQLQRHAIT